MIVVDASAAISALLNAGPARRSLASEQLHVPHLIDSEVANALVAGSLPRGSSLTLHGLRSTSGGDLEWRIWRDQSVGTRSGNPREPVCL